MKTEIEITIMVPVDIDYTPGEKQTHHNPGCPAEASWFKFDHEEVMKRIETELDEHEKAGTFLQVIEQENTTVAAEAAYEGWLERQMMIDVKRVTPARNGSGHN